MPPFWSLSLFPAGMPGTISRARIPRHCGWMRDELRVTATGFGQDTKEETGAIEVRNASVEEYFVLFIAVPETLRDFEIGMKEVNVELDAVMARTAARTAMSVAEHVAV